MLEYNLIKKNIPLANHRKIREDNNGFLILFSKTLELLFLNEVAKDIYLLIDGKNTIDDIFHKIKNIYDAEDIVLKKDITFLIKDLQWKKLIFLKAAS